MTQTVSGDSVIVTEQQVAHWNQTLQTLTPQEVIRWAYLTFPNLYQSTAFGLTGLVTIDMINKLKLIGSVEDIPLIFIDTLYHFPQTHDLVERVVKKYGAKIHVYKPKGTETEEEFKRKHGDQLWEKNESLYDFLVKVEPSQRAYKECGVVAALTGRRRSQGGARHSLPVVELEPTSGVLKINPLFDWDFKQVRDYIDEFQVPYNELLDLGYKSVGDWHSTAPVAEGEDERSGRWKGKAKTECGIHETSKFAQYLKAQEAESVTPNT